MALLVKVYLKIMKNIKTIFPVILIAIVLIIFLPANTEARSGCCSHHGGVCGCRCCDGTPLSAKCAPYYPGCNSKPKPVYEPPPEPEISESKPYEPLEATREQPKTPENPAPTEVDRFESYLIGLTGKVVSSVRWAVDGLKSLSVKAGRFSLGPIIASLSQDKRRTEIESLYQDIFDRVAEEDEINFWVDQNDYSIDDVRRAFLNSHEYEKKIIILEDRYSRQHALKTLYQDFFGSILEIDGKNLEDWKKDNTNILGIKFYFLNSEEYKEKFMDKQDTERLEKIAHLYWTVFRRKPDREGLAYWDQVDLSTEQIREKMLQSSEFDDLLKEYENERGRGPAFEFLFEAIFDRAADSESYNYFIIEENGGNIQSVKEELTQREMRE